MVTLLTVPSGNVRSGSEGAMAAMRSFTRSMAARGFSP